MNQSYGQIYTQWVQQRCWTNISAWAFYVFLKFQATDQFDACCTWIYCKMFKACGSTGGRLMYWWTVDGMNVLSALQGNWISRNDFSWDWEVFQEKAVFRLLSKHVWLSFQNEFCFRQCKSSALLVQVFYGMLLLLLLSHFSRVWLCATPETAAHQAPPSLGFSRQEHWSGLPFPSPVTW